MLNFFSFFFSVTTKFFYLKKFSSLIVYSNPPILPLIPYAFNKLFGTRFIFVAFDIWPDNGLKLNGIKENGIIHKLMDFINKRVYGNASDVILLGNEMKEYVIENEIAPNKNNLRVIPNWFSNESAVQNKKVMNEEFKEIKKEYSFIVLYSGNMGSFQDMETILKGILNFKNHQDVFFIFSGHGNKMNDVKEFLTKNAISNSKVFGFLTGQDYIDALTVSDLCLVSLEKGIEGLGVPSKTYGYLAAGKPVLSIMSSRTDIARDLEQFDCGVNVIQGDITGFEKAINKYYTDPLLQKTASVNARKLYEAKYTKDISVGKYHEMITGKNPNSEKMWRTDYVQR